MHVEWHAQMRHWCCYARGMDCWRIRHKNEMCGLLAASFQTSKQLLFLLATTCVRVLQIDKLHHSNRISVFK